MGKIKEGERSTTLRSMRYTAPLLSKQPVANLRIAYSAPEQPRKPGWPAYILVNFDPVSTWDVAEKLRDINGAVVREVLGPDDFIVDLEADSQEDITAIMRTKIRPIKGVTNTVACLFF